MVEETFTRAGVEAFRIAILHPPTALSSKFTAIGKGRGLMLSAADGGWTIERRGGSQHR